MVEYACQCPKDDPRVAIQRLVDEVKRLRPVVEAAKAWRRDGSDPDVIGLLAAVDTYLSEAPDAA